MNEIRLGNIESKFADIVWAHAPLSTSELVKLCESELGWKRTTTYTVLKRLSDRGIFKNDNRTVTALISKEEFYSMQSERVVKDSFGGSLPAFVAAFTARQYLNEREIEEIRRIIDNMKRG
ncbi:MAG: BlaI/MecI/CopY family transcriptional regulator [Clostridia bacterium]|nr:BlaI/MecI/CopY family transcriptional regulator [Clostridia bacterium]